QRQRCRAGREARRVGRDRRDAARRRACVRGVRVDGVAAGAAHPAHAGGRGHRDDRGGDGRTGGGGGRRVGDGGARVGWAVAAPGLIAPPTVAPWGAIALPVTLGEWKSMLAAAAPAPAPGRCHVADAVVTPARNTTRSTRLRRGCSMPLRRASIETALCAGGR